MEDEFKEFWKGVWGQNVLCSPVVQQRTLLYVLPGSSRVTRLQLGWVSLTSAISLIAPKCPGRFLMTRCREFLSWAVHEPRQVEMFTSQNGFLAQEFAVKRFPWQVVSEMCMCILEEDPVTQSLTQEDACKNNQQYLIKIWDQNGCICRTWSQSREWPVLQSHKGTG